MRLFSSLLFVSILSAPASASQQVSTAARFWFNENGLALVAQEIKSNALTDVISAPIDDFDDDLGGGVQLYSEELSYSLTFGAVSLVSQAGRLDLKIDVKAITIHAEKLQFKKKSAVTISTTCRNTNIHLGEGGSLALRLGLTPTVGQDLRFAMTPSHVQFPVSADEYRVDGPARCSGALGVGSLVKFAVAKVLEKARARVQDTVESRVHGQIPQIASMIDQQLHRAMPFKLTLSPALPPVALVGRTAPYSVQVTSEGLEFVMSVGFEPGTLDPERRREDLSDKRLVSFGTIGINPEVLNELLDSVRPLQPEVLEVTENLVPNLGDFLNREALAAIWPDLNDVVLDESRLRVFVSFTSAPVITLRNSEAGANATVTIPDLKFTFYAKRAGRWQRYFHLHLATAAALHLDVREGHLHVSIGEDPEVTISGEWDASYVPKVDLFEKDLVTAVFRTLFDVVASRGALVNMAVPSLAVGASQVTFSSPRAELPYLVMDMIAPL